jgi:hypothetical protein
MCGETDGEILSLVEERGVDAGLETLREDCFKETGGAVGVEKDTEETEEVAVEAASEF